MANKKIYEVEVVGTEKAAGALRSFEDTLAKGGTEAAKTFGDAFKGLSRDIDVIGGEMTAKVTKGISDFLGVAEALGTGGILGPIAAVSAAVGVIVGAVSKWKEEEAEVAKKAEEVRKAMAESQKATQAFIEKFAESITKANAAITMQTLAAQSAQITARDVAIDGLDKLEKMARERATNAIKIERDIQRYKEITAEADALRQQRLTLVAEQEAAKQKRIEDGKLFAKREATAAEAADSEATRLRLEEQDKKRAELRKLRAKEGADYEIAFRKSIADYEALVMEDEAARLKALDDQKEAEYQAERARLADLAPLDADRDIEAEYKMEQARLKAIDGEKNLRQAIYERGLAQIGTSATTVGLEGVTMAMGMTSLVVNSMMQPLINTLQAYGTINRENWRDLLQFNEDFRNNMAAQVQIALWGLAQQAASKSVFEAGEGFREQASALGAAATGNFASAGLHQTSAIMHFVARDAYAGIAGVSAGASIGVGMQRGEGGLFGLTKEERERRDRERASGGGPAAEGPTVRGIGGGQGPGAVVVNFVYEAGAIDARSRDAAAATVAASAREARRDGFLRRRMAAG